MVAPNHAHLQSIKIRRKGLIKEERENMDEDTGSAEMGTDKKSIMNVITRHPKMRLPKVHDSLTWGKRRKNHLSTEDTALVSAAISSLNKFSNDGSFIDDFIHPKNDSSGDSSNSSYENYEGRT